MTVAELIAELQKHDPHAHVVTRHDTVVERFVERFVVNSVEKAHGVAEQRADHEWGEPNEYGTPLRVCVMRDAKDACIEGEQRGGTFDVVVLGTTQELSDGHEHRADEACRPDEDPSDVLPGHRIGPPDSGGPGLRAVYRSTPSGR